MIRDSILVRTLLLSALFHLSAVTLFRIVIYFPRQDIEFYDISIIQTRAPFHPLAARPEPAGGAFGPFEQLGLSGPDFSADDAEALPAVQLPILHFDELSLMRLRRQVLDTRSRYNEVFSDSPDAWARFGEGLETVGATISRLTFGENKASPRPTPVSRPAPGFEAYIEWMSGPYDRRVVSVEPIHALWGANPESLGEPIALIFRVDRSGHVIEVIDPLGDAEGYVESSVAALRAYRFEPLFGDGPATQSGTLIVRGRRDAP